MGLGRKAVEAGKNKISTRMNEIANAECMYCRKPVTRRANVCKNCSKSGNGWDDK